MGRFWKAVIPARAFRLERGDDAHAHYAFGGARIHHLFCRTCGIKSFARGRAEGIGDFVAINIACLDATADELAGAPVRYENGRSDDWASRPAEIRHL